MGATITNANKVVEQTNQLIHMANDTEREVVSIDDAGVCASIAYGYRNKREAAEAIAKETGEPVKDVLPYLVKKRVTKEKKPDGDYFFWGDVCTRCGQKNNGVLSWVWEG